MQSCGTNGTHDNIKGLCTSKYVSIVQAEAYTIYFTCGINLTGFGTLNCYKLVEALHCIK